MTRPVAKYMMGQRVRTSAGDEGVIAYIREPGRGEPLYRLRDNCRWWLQHEVMDAAEAEQRERAAEASSADWRIVTA